MYTLIFVLIVLAVLGAVGWFAWGLVARSGGSLFGASKDRRIGVSEVANVDGKRKLLLIYRDGIEHLVMTGGPIDVVIEQGIAPQRRGAMTSQQPQGAQYSAGFESRLTAASAPPQSPLEAAEAPLPPGRLRQRGVPQTAQDTYVRGERTAPPPGSQQR
jgi:flagellar protein FliO/FliZ